MKRLILVLVIALIAAIANARGPVSRQEPRTYLDYTREEVVPLMDATGRIYCTGWVAAKDVLVTAAHCADSPAPVYALIKGHTTKFKKMYLGVSATEHDVAVLAGDTRDITPLPLADKLPELPAMCFWVGYAGEPQSKLMPGMLRHFEPDGMLSGIGQGRGGDSGGPILGEGGKVIGLIWGRQPPHDTRKPEKFYVVKIENILFALKAVGLAPK